MSEENEVKQDNPTKEPKGSNRLTDIDWDKETPKTAEAWMTLSPEERLDWCIWHEDQMQSRFAAIVTLLGIGGAAFAIYKNESGTGYSVLIGVVAFIVIILLLAFSSFLYRALRALAIGILVAILPAIVIHFAVEPGTMQIVLIVTDFVCCIALLGWMESKGWLARKEPKFPPPKEPGVLEDLNKLRKDMKKALASMPKRPKKKKKEKTGGSWLQNTIQNMADEGYLNTELYPRPRRRR